MKKEYLPIGTVCILKGGTKKVMIIGFCSIPKEDSSKIFDYSGCLYPEGLISSNQICLFNNDQIEKIYHKGFDSQEDLDFKDKLENIMEKISKSDKNRKEQIEKFDVES